MAVTLIVNGISYSYPTNRDSQGWGVNSTDWAQAVTNVLSAAISPNDVGPSANIVINNNAASFTDIPGLSFSPSQVRAVDIEYYVYRVVTGSTPAELIESGNLYVNYKTIANTWGVTPIGAGNAGMTFQVTPAGQVQYTSSNLTITGGGTHTGVFKFRARALNQV